MRKLITIVQKALSWLFAGLVLLSIANSIRFGLDPHYYFLSISLILLGGAFAAALILGYAPARKCAAALCLLMAISVPFFPILEHSKLDTAAILIRVIPSVALLLMAAYLLDYRDKPQQNSHGSSSGSAV